MKKVLLILSFSVLSVHLLTAQAAGSPKGDSTITKVVRTLRQVIVQEQQKYSNYKLNENMEVPMFLDGKMITMDTLLTKNKEDIASITINFHPKPESYAIYGSRVTHGIIEILSNKLGSK